MLLYTFEQVEKLNNRIKELETAIREHRSQKADDRCIEDDDKLYEVLGDGVKCDRSVGSKEEMLKNCQRFIENRCEGGKWESYADLEKRAKKYSRIIRNLYQVGPIMIKDIEEAISYAKGVVRDDIGYYNG